MRLRELRQQRGWSQEHLAELSGLSVRTIQRAETGHSTGAASLTALAGVFGVEVEQLAATTESAPAETTFFEAIGTCFTNAETSPNT